MPELGRLQRLGREPGRLLERQRAHLGGGPGRAAAEQGQRGPVVEPALRRVGARVGVGQQPLGACSQRPRRRRPAAAGSAGQRREPRPASRACRRTSSSRGPCSSPARVSRAMSASRGQRVRGAVGDRRRCSGRSPRSGAARTRRTSSALSPDWLTQTSSESGLEQRQAEVQQLGRVDHRASAPAAASQGGDDRVAGVVGAAHPGEQDDARATRPASARRRGDAVGLFDGRRPARRMACGLARDLGHESVRKLS